MRYGVVRVRSRGVLVPRRTLSILVPVVGELRVAEERDEQLGRPVLRATLVDPVTAHTRELLPALHQPVLLWMGPNGFTLGGYERVGDGDRLADFAQTWWVRPVEAPRASR